MPAAKKTSAKSRSVKRHVLSPVVININTALNGPSVDQPVAVVHSNQQIQWVASSPVDFWVVKVERNDSVFDQDGGYVFYPGNDTTAPLEFNGQDIIKYSVATPSGVLDPHIIPMP